MLEEFLGNLFVIECFSENPLNHSLQSGWKICMFLLLFLDQQLVTWRVFENFGSVKKIIKLCWVALTPKTLSIHLKIVVNNFYFIFHELMLTVKRDPVINAPEQTKKKSIYSCLLILYCRFSNNFCTLFTPFRTLASV
jgi:hypothetical protein